MDELRARVFELKIIQGSVATQKYAACETKAGEI
jgi:hypothetical protein